MAVDAGVVSVVVVVMQPGLVGGGSFCFTGVGLGVCPFSGEGAVEALHLPVGLRSVGLGPFMLHGVAERVGECVVECWALFVYSLYYRAQRA